MEKKYHGLVPPIVTPILENEDVDEKSFRALIDYSIENGTDGIFVCGTNGETMQLTQAQRNNAIRICVDHTKGRVPVFAGVMDTSTRRVIENIKAAQDVGATAMAVTPIFYDRHTSQDETVRHFERILKETDDSLDIFVYNIPPFTGEKITPKAALEIAALSPRVRGYKDSSGANGEFLKVLEAKRDDMNFSVLEGIPIQGMGAFLFGCDGYVPALGPCFPELFSVAYKVGRAGDLDLAWKCQKLIRETGAVNLIGKNPTASSKYAISLRVPGMRKDVIWPQDVTTAEDEQKIKAKVAEIDEHWADLHKEIKAKLGF